MGIFAVAGLAASGPSVPLATITSTFKRTGSSAMRASRAASFSAYLISSEALFPSIQPNCLRASINTCVDGDGFGRAQIPYSAHSFRRSGCCPRAASGHLLLRRHFRVHLFARAVRSQKAITQDSVPSVSSTQSNMRAKKMVCPIPSQCPSAPSAAVNWTNVLGQVSRS
jgi:hypothetical protein